MGRLGSDAPDLREGVVGAEVGYDAKQGQQHCSDESRKNERPRTTGREHRQKDRELRDDKDKDIEDADITALGSRTAGLMSSPPGSSTSSGPMPFQPPQFSIPGATRREKGKARRIASERGPGFLNGQTGEVIIVDMTMDEDMDDPPVQLRSPKTPTREFIQSQCPAGPKRRSRVPNRPTSHGMSTSMKGGGSGGASGRGDLAGNTEMSSRPNSAPYGSV